MSKLPRMWHDGRYPRPDGSLSHQEYYDRLVERARLRQKPRWSFTLSVTPQAIFGWKFSVHRLEVSTPDNPLGHLQGWLLTAYLSFINLSLEKLVFIDDPPPTAEE